MKALIFNIQRFSIHDGNGIRTTVFFKGCNMRCKWCANPESQSLLPEYMDNEEVGQYYSLEALLAEILKDKPFFDKSNGGITLSGGEPLLQPEFVCSLCNALHAAEINVGIETAACVAQNVFAKVLNMVDYALIDLKHWSTERHKEGTGVDNHQVLNNIRYAFSQTKPVTIRIPIIPGYTNSKKDAAEFASLLKELGANNVHVLPFHQMGENKYEKLGLPYEYSGTPQLHDTDVSEFAQVIASVGIDVQIGG